MPILNKTTSDKTTFGGLGWVTEWLSVQDPSGGLNKSGAWPASVQELKDGSLIVATSSY